MIRLLLTPVVIDGLLYALVAMFGCLETEFSSDDAAKYIAPHTLFWIKAVVSVIAARALAVKLFRSTAYSDHVAQKKIETSFMNRPTP